MRNRILLLLAVVAMAIVALGCGDKTNTGPDPTDKSHWNTPPPKGAGPGTPAMGSDGKPMSTPPGMRRRPPGR